MWSKRQHLTLVVAPSALAMCLKSARGRVIHSAQLAHKTDVETPALTGLDQGLGRLAGQFPAVMRRADTQVSVALPDPMFQQSLLEFDAFPKSAKEASRLVAWRHARDLNLNANDVSVGWHRVDTGKSATATVLAQSLHQQSSGAVQSALWANGLVATRIDALSSFLTPRRPAKAAAQSGLYFWRGPEWWCFRILGPGTRAEPIFASWGAADVDDQNMLRRLKRICAAATPAPAYVAAFLKAASPASPTLATLEAEQKMAVTATHLASWTTVAERLGAR